ncbi:LysR substrate-binding domain-containing protein [Biformimicrobium ophioploci]|uniref:Transcriptional regulator GcvA n=1 Tax=Biformimicrobium ophioploci TaxID=3036711 RepID=A0ABQ6LWD3_9GAMM|nr:LysR substrate-binding domain-containing protein [Microbulbifer sp. NKW57]GMG86402.1 transcriptional regulator GcvA [Microbulbifer sp. NKW57]
MLLTRRRLPLNAMRAFEVAARHCNLRLAAQELGVSHSAVSRQIKQLEALLQLDLFDRSHNRLSLTSSGRQLYTGVSEGLDRIAESVLYLDPDSVEGSLVVASTPSIGAGWLVSVITSFCQRFPDIDIRLTNIEPRQQELPRDVDIAICYGKPEAGGRKIETLFREQYFPACHRALLNETGPIRRPQDLLQLPLLHDQHGLWRRWFSLFDIDAEIPQRIFFEDSFQVLTAIRSGFGVGLVEQIDVQGELERGELVRLFDETVHSAEQHYLLTDDDKRATMRAKLFVQYLKENLQACTKLHQQSAR